MAYDNNNTANRAASYTITFQVDLSSPDFPFPNPNGNQTDATMAASRSTWIPQGVSIGDEHRVFRHGDQFTVYDDVAYYLKNKYLRSTSNPYGVLTVVTETV